MNLPIPLLAAVIVTVAAFVYQGPVADPGFQRGVNLWGRQPTIWPIFSENCMKMKKYWPRELGVSLVPPRSANAGPASCPNGPNFSFMIFFLKIGAYSQWESWIRSSTVLRNPIIDIKL